MRPLDEEYARERARLTSEWREKAKALLERVWDSLRDWRPWKGVEVKAYVNGLKVVFDDPSYLWIGVEGREVEARLHLYYFTEAYAPRLKSILEAIRGVKLKCLVQVDGRPGSLQGLREDYEGAGLQARGSSLQVGDGDRVVNSPRRALCVPSLDPAAEGPAPLQVSLILVLVAGTR
jgi:hypothetical protein